MSLPVLTNKFDAIMCQMKAYCCDEQVVKCKSEDFNVLAALTNRLSKFVDQGGGDMRRIVLDNESYLQTLAYALQVFPDSGMRSSLTHLFLRLIGKVDVSNRASKLVKSDLTRSACQALASEHSTSHPDEDLLFRLHKLLCRLAPVDARFGIRARVNHCLSITVNMLKIQISRIKPLELVNGLRASPLSPQLTPRPVSSINRTATTINLLHPLSPACHKKVRLLLLTIRYYVKRSGRANASLIGRIGGIALLLQLTTLLAGLKTSNVFNKQLLQSRPDSPSATSLDASNAAFAAAATSQRHLPQSASMATLSITSPLTTSRSSSCLGNRAASMPAVPMATSSSGRSSSSRQRRGSGAQSCLVVVSRPSAILLKMLLASLKCLIKWKLNVSRALAIDGMGCLLDLFLHLHRPDASYSASNVRRFELQRATLGCMKSLTTTRHGRKCFIAHGGLHTTYAICCGFTGPNLVETSSLDSVDSQTERKKRVRKKKKSASDRCLDNTKIDPLDNSTSMVQSPDPLSCTTTEPVSTANVVDHRMETSKGPADGSYNPLLLTLLTETCALLRRCCPRSHLPVASPYGAVKCWLPADPRQRDSDKSTAKSSHTKRLNSLDDQISSKCDNPIVDSGREETVNTAVTATSFDKSDVKPVKPWPPSCPTVAVVPKSGDNDELVGKSIVTTNSLQSTDSTSPAPLVTSNVFNFASVIKSDHPWLLGYRRPFPRHRKLVKKKQLSSSTLVVANVQRPSSEHSSTPPPTTLLMSMLAKRGLVSSSSSTLSSLTIPDKRFGKVKRKRIPPSHQTSMTAKNIRSQSTRSANKKHTNGGDKNPASSSRTGQSDLNELFDLDFSAFDKQLDELPSSNTTRSLRGPSFIVEEEKSVTNLEVGSGVDHRSASSQDDASSGSAPSLSIDHAVFFPEWSDLPEDWFRNNPSTVSPIDCEKLLLAARENDKVEWSSPTLSDIKSQTLFRPSPLTNRPRGLSPMSSRPPAINSLLPFTTLAYPDLVLAQGRLREGIGDGIQEEPLACYDHRLDCDHEEDEEEENEQSGDGDACLNRRQASKRHGEERANSLAAASPANAKFKTRRKLHSTNSPSSSLPPCTYPLNELPFACLLEDIRRLVDPKDLVNRVVFDLDEALVDQAMTATSGCCYSVAMAGSLVAKPSPTPSDRFRPGLSVIKSCQQPSSLSLNDSTVSNRDELLIDSYDADIGHLLFESQFECGNLRKAIQIRQFEYDLVLSPDINTCYNVQWFYFRVSNMQAGYNYRFNIVNCEKPSSQFGAGMQPVMLSVKDSMADWAKGLPAQWLRTGSKVTYYRNHYMRPNKTSSSHHKRHKSSSASSNAATTTQDDSSTSHSNAKESTTLYTATFTVQFKHTGDVCYIAYHYPYTLTRLMTQLDAWQQASVTSTSIYYRCQQLTSTILGNGVPLVTITTGAANPVNKVNANQRWLGDRTADNSSGYLARVHPGESNSSWIMQGLIDRLLSTNDPTIDRLRQRHIFKLVPMLNPDGVVCGNHRCSMAGKDLNRCWIRPSEVLQAPIYHTRQLISLLTSLDRRPYIFIDIHGHSRMKNIFLYGCSKFGSKGFGKSLMETENDTENSYANQYITKLLADISPYFNQKSCSFTVCKAKRGAARVAVWNSFNIPRSYTIEASYCGFNSSSTQRYQLSPYHLQQFSGHLLKAIHVLPEYEVERASKTAPSPLLLEGQDRSDNDEDDDSEHSSPSLSRSSSSASSLSESGSSNCSDGDSSDSSLSSCADVIDDDDGDDNSLLNETTPKLGSPQPTNLPD